MSKTLQGHRTKLHKNTQKCRQSVVTGYKCCEAQPTSPFVLYKHSLDGVTTALTSSSFWISMPPIWSKM